MRKSAQKNFVTTRIKSRVIFRFDFGNTSDKRSNATLVEHALPQKVTDGGGGCSGCVGAERWEENVG